MIPGSSLSLKLSKKALKYPVQKMHTTSHAGLQTAGITKWTANEIGYAGRSKRGVQVSAVISSGIHKLVTSVVR